MTHHPSRVSCKIKTIKILLDPEAIEPFRTQVVSSNVYSNGAIVLLLSKI